MVKLNVFYYKMNARLISINIMLVMFFTSGVDKILNFDSTVRGFMSKVPVSQSLARLAILAAIVIEIAAPLLINYGHYHNRNATALGLLSLVVFTILATLIYHFPPRGKQYYAFMSNLTTIGGLMLALALYVK